jgi:hypothetical protein
MPVQIKSSELSGYSPLCKGGLLRPTICRLLRPPFLTLSGNSSVLKTQEMISMAR